MATDPETVSLSVENPEAENLDFSKGEAVPSRFVQVPLLCCAFNLFNCSPSSCFGCKGFTQCLCIEEEGFCCKMISNHRSCCVCLASSVEIVTCPSALRCYRQCLCCECVCGCPYNRAFKETEVHFTNVPNRDGGAITDQSKPCAAFCCEVSSCYFSFPGCLSGYSKGTCCCCESQALCCKPVCCGSNARKKSLLCVLERANLLCVTPTTLCKSITQCCCLDNRCAIPCDDEVPCLCMPLPFCTVCANYQCKFGCCKSIVDLTGKNNAV